MGMGAQSAFSQAEEQSMMPARATPKHEACWALRTCLGKQGDCCGSSTGGTAGRRQQSDATVVAVAYPVFLQGDKAESSSPEHAQDGEAPALGLGPGHEQAC